MKNFPRNATAPSRRRAAFTIVEMMVSSGIFLGVFVGVIVAIQVFALRIYTLAATKLTATEGSRKAMNQIRDDIRQGKGLLVGVADNTGRFTACYGTNAASGNALIIYSTTNFGGVPYSLYFLQTNTVSGISSNNLICLQATASTTNLTKLATYITNLDIFCANDCFGNVITNFIQNNQVFSVKMQFYQWEYPLAMVGTNGNWNAYDYYQLRTKVCRRALD